MIKARSEYLIAPILSEIVTLNPQTSLFSGKSFNAEPSMGLNGFVDFLLKESGNLASNFEKEKALV